MANRRDPVNYKLIIFISLAMGFLPLLSAQSTGFLDHIRIGFGGGINNSQLIDLQSYSVYEDLSGATYVNRYSSMTGNIGIQYFLHAEWYNEFLVIAIKPGTYTHRFRKLNEVIFTGETIEQETPYLLHYFSVPLEARFPFDVKRFRPYLGATIAYSHLLSSQDASSQTFIRPRFSAGGVIGTYMELKYITLELNVGYRSGLHNITSKSGRFESGNGGSFAQDDILLNDLQVNFSLLFPLQKQKNFSNTQCYY